ncbi:hypothetical protein [Dactylosporangium sp. NPDC051541]|uniref:hypothetical protein n=1 Tax=Dactylosporangium sp. NPDC051541 TaxID=3363977 RepID=UPI0037977524
MRIVGLLAAVCLVVGGCAAEDAKDTVDTGAVPRSSPSPSLDPAGRLDAAVAANLRVPFQFKLSGPGMPAGALSGVADPPGGVLDLKATFSTELAVDYFRDGSGLYVKMSGFEDINPDSASWFKADPAKLTGDDFISVVDPQNPMQLRDIVAATNAVHEAGPGQLAGTLDPKKLKGPLIEEQDQAAAVPVTVTLDTEGHLTKLTLDSPDGGSLSLEFEQFGQALDVTAPTADATKPMPDEMYQALNADN